MRRHAEQDPFDAGLIGLATALLAWAAFMAGCASSQAPGSKSGPAAAATASTHEPSAKSGPAAQRPTSRPAASQPGEAGEPAFGLPRRDLRVVAFNVHWDLEGVDRIVAAVRPLEPDVLFMEEVLEKDLEEIGSRAGMSSGGRVQVFYSPRPPEGTSGTAIFARFPLSGGQFILPTGEAGEHGDWGHGAWAEATIDGQRVALACVHLTPTQGITPRHLLEREVRRGAEISSLLDFWRSKGSPPALFGGDFNQLPMGANYQALSAGFTDALAALGKTDWTCEFGPLHTRIDYLWLSPGWHAVDGEVVASDASDHRPIWARVRGGQ